MATYQTIANLKGPRGFTGPRGLPGTNAVPADSAVAGYVEADDSATAEALFERYQSFDLEKAHIRFALRFGQDAPANSVHQSVFVIAALDGEIWYTRTTTGLDNPSLEDYIIYRCSPAGVFMEELRVVNGGHGNSVFIEVDDGDIYVWSYFTRPEFPAGNPSRYAWSRFLWRTGIVRYTDVDDTPVTVLNGRYGTPHFDEYAGIVGFRWNDTSLNHYVFEVHTLDNLRDGIDNPIHSTSIAQASLPAGPQNFTYGDGMWYFLTGHESIGNPTNVAYIVAIDAVTGAIVHTRDINRLRLAYQAAQVNGFSEMEGLCVIRDARGTMSLGVGHSSGGSSRRQNLLSVLTMDSAYPSGAFTSDDVTTRWIQVTNFKSGFSTNPARPFMLRRRGQYLELNGDILASGALASGAYHNPIQLGSGFRPAVTRYAVISVGSSDGDPGEPGDSPANSVAFGRMALTAGGNIRVFFEPSEYSAPPSLHFDGVRIFLGDQA